MFDRNMVQCVNIVLAHRPDMRDESKPFISDKRGENNVVKTKTKEELKHLSSQSLVSGYAAANQSFHASKRHQSVSAQ